MSGLQAIIEELECADVHAGFHVERQRLAGHLLEQGIGAEDVALLAAHVVRTVSNGDPAKVLAALLVDPPRRDDRLRDLRRVAATKQQRHAEKARAPGDAPAAQPWSRDRICGLLACGVDRDHRLVIDVAQDLGIDPSEDLDAMLRHGRELLGERRVVQPTPMPTAKAVQRAEREAIARVDDFRDRMRRDRVSGAQRRSQKRGVDWARLQKCKVALIESIRETVVVDLARVFPDPTMRGALAELEADGVVLRCGDPDHLGRQPHVVARDDAQRAEFRAHVARWCEADRSRRGRTA